MHHTPTASTRSHPHRPNTVTPAASKKLQSNNEPNTANAGIVENRFGGMCASNLDSEGGRGGVDEGGGGKEVRSWTMVERRYIPCVCIVCKWGCTWMKRNESGLTISCARRSVMSDVLSVLFVMRRAWNASEIK
jgi:hypothetical protein